MKPDFKIIVIGKQDITDAIKERLINLTVTDEVSLTSDTLKIIIDDAGAKTKVPKKNVKLSVLLGYVETGLIPHGNFVVDTVALSGPPDKMEITARGANFTQALRQPKNRSWHEITLGDIAQKIGVENNLIAQVSPDLEQEFIDHEDQTNESDISFLTRLANQYDAAVKPSATHIIIVKKAMNRSVSGKNLPPVDIKYTDITSWNAALPERDRYSAVIAAWTDTATAKEIEEKAGSGTPVYRIRKQFTNASEAKKAVEATLRRLNRKDSKITINMPGNPNVIAESPVMLSGFRAEFNGKWTVKKAEHKMSKSGYTLSIDCEPLND